MSNGDSKAILIPNSQITEISSSREQTPIRIRTKVNGSGISGTTRSLMKSKNYFPKDFF
jgi:hypothetical protein